MAIAIPIGLVLATGVGAVTLWTGVAHGEQAVLIATVFALVMSWGLVALVWSTIVDRTSLRGAIDKPEESIESIWLDAAMAGAFRDTLMVTGLSLAILAAAGFTFDPSLPLAFRLAEVFECSLEELFDPRGESTHPS